jgi:hypothetical protein
MLVVFPSESPRPSELKGVKREDQQTPVPAYIPTWGLVRHPQPVSSLSRAYGEITSWCTRRSGAFAVICPSAFDDMAIQQTEYSVTRYYHLEQARWACFVYSHCLVIATAITRQSPKISIKCIKVTIGPKPFSLSAVMCFFILHRVFSMSPQRAFRWPPLYARYC